jgi:FHS family L-fucose permease-like MFS transporter
MKYIAPRKILATLAVVAVICCITAIYNGGFLGLYALMIITGCMSLMFPTIYGMGIRGLGEDTKIGGAGMVMAIAGAAFLTQIQGIVSDFSSVKLAYWIPTIAFGIIAYYSLVVCKKYETAV